MTLSTYILYSENRAGLWHKWSGTFLQNFFISPHPLPPSVTYISANKYQYKIIALLIITSESYPPSLIIESENLFFHFQREM